MLGLVIGPCPPVNAAGVWLYTGGNPILHVVERDEIPASNGVLDHIAFRGTDLSAVAGRLKKRGIPYDLRRSVDRGAMKEIWQLFFEDVNGARVEIDFPANELPPQES